MHAITIYPCDLSRLTAQVIKNGLLQVLPADFYHKVEENELRYFMHQYGIYVLPTLELIEWLKFHISTPAIEIGCGNGAIGRELGIPITDSKLQERENVKTFYQLSKQPTISYPADVEQLDAISAIGKYKPTTVIGAFITHKYNGHSGNMYGVVEGKILKLCKKYIHIGNKVTHHDKPILKHKHAEYYFDWLITRGVYQQENCIWVFNQ